MAVNVMNRRILMTQALASGGAPAGYVGPGDVVSGATAWWGFRAYNNAVALAGGNLVDIFGSNTGTTFTFVSKTDGTIELVAGGAAAFLAANPGNTSVVVKVYDQTGNGHHMTATGAQTPFWAVGSVGSYGATANFVPPKSLTATGFIQVQPFSYAGSFMFTSHSGVQSLLSDSTQVGFNFNTTPALALSAPTVLINSATLTDTIWYAVQGVYNGASSAVIVNSTVTTGNAGTNSINSAHTLSIGSDDFTEALTGFMGEMGMWPVAFNSTQYTAMGTNIQMFYSSFLVTGSGVILTTDTGVKLVEP
jgi:hypothetical protein